MGDSLVIYRASSCDHLWGPLAEHVCTLLARNAREPWTLPIRSCRTTLCA